VAAPQGNKNVFRQRKEEGDSPVRVLLRAAWGRSFHKKDPCWQRHMLGQCSPGLGNQQMKEISRLKSGGRQRRHRFVHQVAEIFWSNTLLNSYNQEQSVLHYKHS